MKRSLAGFAATLAMALPAAASTIVINGSFESGVPGDVEGAYGNTYGKMPYAGSLYQGWDIWGGLNSWSLTSGSGIEVQTNPTLGFAPQDGYYYLEMDSKDNFTMEQTVVLEVGKYLLTFWYSPRTDDAASNGVSYSISGLLAGGTTGPSKQDGTEVGRWTKIARQFDVKEAGKYALALAGEGRSDGLGGFIDNVSIDVQPPEEQPSQVPVPAAGLLLLGALGGLGALRRKA